METTELLLAILAILGLIVGYFYLVAKLPPVYRIILVALTIFGAFHVGTRLGRTMERVRIMATYGRVVKFSYYEIADSMQKLNHLNAMRIATNMLHSFYIESPEDSPEHLEELNGIISGGDK